jgi:hypothetical protein
MTALKKGSNQQDPTRYSSGQIDGIKDERNKATYMVIRPFFSFKHVELCKQIEKLLTILVLKK